MNTIFIIIIALLGLLLISACYQSKHKIPTIDYDSYNIENFEINEHSQSNKYDLISNNNFDNGRNIT